MKYVAICIALYDYSAQSDEELTFKADDILYILENNDPDWYKAQLKLINDQDGPVGLIPSNYIEKAKSIGSLKALYDYQAQSVEEVSFKENDTLILYEKDDPNWFIIEKSNGEIGLAPSNYVSEEHSAPSPAPAQQTWAVALYAFKPESDEETHLDQNEQVLVSNMDNPDWWTIQHNDGTSGVVPANYLQLQDKSNNQQEDEQRIRREQEEKARQEQEERTRQEEEERIRRMEEEAKQREMEEFNRLKELEEKEMERQAEVERRKRLQEEAKQRELEIKKQASAAASSPQLTNSPRRNQIPAPPPPPPTVPTHSYNQDQQQPEYHDPNKPNPVKVRTWTDNTGAFKVDAQLLSCANGKIRLHKVNGVKIDVPVSKMCVEDLRYIEAETGMKLLPEFSWLNYFKKINLPQRACVEYAETFKVNQLKESDIEHLTYRQMKVLGMSEKHIQRLQRFIETNQPEPPSDNESILSNPNKPKSKVKKSVTFGGVSYIEDVSHEEGDNKQSQIEQDERYARQLQEQEHHQHVSLHRRGTGRPTPTRSAPQNVDFAVLTPQPFQSPTQSTATTTNTTLPPPPPAHATFTNTNDNQFKSGFDDDAWTPRSVSSSNQQTNTSVPPQLPVRQKSSAPPSQQISIEPELIAKWTGSPSLAAANNRPVPAPPLTSNNLTPIQNNNFLSTNSPIKNTLNLPQQSNSFQQHSPVMNNHSFQPSPIMNQQSFQSSPNFNNNNMATFNQQQTVPLQSVLPAPLVPQATSNTSFTQTQPQLQQQMQTQILPQMTGRNWSSSTPDNPFGASPMMQQQQQQQQPTGYIPQQPTGYIAQQPTGFVTQQPTGFVAQQPTGFVTQQPTGFVAQQPTGFGQQPTNQFNTYNNTIDPTDKYAVFKTLNTTPNTSSIFNTTR